MIKRMTNGTILWQDKWVLDMDLVYDEKIIGLIGKEEKYDQPCQMIDLQGNRVIPGLIDVHIHGYQGSDAMDAKESSLRNISTGIAANGVTSFLATTMTMPMERIVAALEAIRPLVGQHLSGAEILGVHLEGPFINPDYKGAQPEEAILLPEETILGTFHDIIKVVTIAPERQGAMDMIKRWHESINFSLGHTAADYETAHEAFEIGAKSVTHLFNAMTGLHHRKPGVVGAALTHDCYCELIADGIHVQPVLFPMLKAAKGTDRILLITDCMQGANLPEGEYELGGQKVLVQDGKCTLASGTIAGSVLKLHDGLKRFSQNAACNEIDAIKMATINQARYLGVEASKGSIDVNKDSDLVVMTSDYDILKTIVKGKSVYENQI